jgi:hypothetical protein
MARTAVRRAPDGAAFHARLRRGGKTLAVLLPILLLVGVAVGRATTVSTHPTVISLTGAVSDVSPDELKLSAAGVIQAAIADGGTGVSFRIVQRTTLHTKPGGPPLQIPDSASPNQADAHADAQDLGSVIEQGNVTPAGFWMEMRDGPATPDGQPDFDSAQYEYGTIATDGLTYRNDGGGWYPTDVPPGIGLDPASAPLLPRMLRQATDAKDGDPSQGGDGVTRTLQATTTVDDLPGIIAVDGAPFTKLTAPVVLGFDDQGRLIRLSVIAQNMGWDRYDMLVQTDITFSYPLTAPPIPSPEPLVDPNLVKPEG